LRDDNQLNTCPYWAIAFRGYSCRNLNLGRKQPGFDAVVFYEIRNKGCIVAEMGKQETLVRSQSVVARVVAGETLIVPVRAKVGDLASIYSFNRTGTLIWKLLETPKSVAELATAIAQEYEVEPEQAQRDVADFVGEMKAVGLVEVPATAAMAAD
jgi:hypothetical protein